MEADEGVLDEGVERVGRAGVGNIVFICCVARFRDEYGGVLGKLHLPRPLRS